MRSWCIGLLGLEVLRTVVRVLGVHLWLIQAFAHVAGIFISEAGNWITGCMMPQAGELLSLNPLSLAVWVTAVASETPALTSSNTVRNLKQPKNKKTKQSTTKEPKEKRKGKRKQKPQKPKQMGVEIRSETPRLLSQFLPAWFLLAARSVQSG